MLTRVHTPKGLAEIAVPSLEGHTRLRVGGATMEMEERRADRDPRVAASACSQRRRESVRWRLTTYNNDNNDHDNSNDNDHK